MTDAITSSSAIPLLGKLTSLVVNGGGNIQSQSKATGVDRTLGVAATLGLSFAIIRLVAYALNASTFDRNEDHEDRDWTNCKRTCLGLIKSFLRRLLQEEEEMNHSKKQSEEDLTLIAHTGSCHCRSVECQVIAPRILNVKNGPGKIQYPHVLVKANHFRLLRGNEFLRTYYVDRSLDGSMSEVGAHAFCVRCGVHLLYAPSAQSSEVEINVNCLGPTKTRTKKASVKDCISDGVPLPGQWEEKSERSEKATSQSDERTPSMADQNKLQKLHSKFLKKSQDDLNFSSNNSVDVDEMTPPIGMRTPAALPDTPLTVPSTGADFSLLEIRELEFDQESTNESANECESATFSSTSNYQEPMSSTTSMESMITAKTFESSNTFNTTTTPMMRDQLNFYMRKHLKSTGTNDASTKNDQIKTDDNNLIS